MDAINVDRNESDRSTKKRSLAALTAARKFLLVTLALSGGRALIDLYASGQNITKYLLYGAFVGLFITLAGLGRDKETKVP